jgi:Tol biopolymer transport system component
VQIGGPSGATGPYAVSETGILAYISGSPLGAGTLSQLTWLSRDGRTLGTLGDQAIYSDVELSNDATRLAVSVNDLAQRTADIWIFDVARGLRTKFTFAPGNEGFLTWSPDGIRVVYAAQPTPTTLLWRMSDGSGVEEKLIQHSGPIAPRSWSPDGKFLAVDLFGAGSNDIGIVQMTGERKISNLTNTSTNENTARFAPDGRWIAYVSTESGRPEVYVAPFPGPGGKSLISTAGGIQPRWRRDGGEIFYVGLDNKLMAAAVNGKGSGFQVGAVKALFDVSQRTGFRYQYDTPDGQRFVVNFSVRQEESTQPITLVTNWMAGLKGK